MAPDTRSARVDLLTIRIAQLLLVVAAGALWMAARLPWVVVRSFDGLGPPKEVALSGASWSTVLLPLALLMLATAVAAIAVRGWLLRVLAGLLAAASLLVGYLGASLWVLPDVAVRGADLAHVSLLALVESQRHYLGAGVAVSVSGCTLIAAALLMRSASVTGSACQGRSKYVAPAQRRSIARRDDVAMTIPEMSERMIWDALDEDQDLTEWPCDPDVEGR
ncbi:TIGR02234 family membrane protein [Mycobacterium uberis]|uniref:TIGR02234 family membrane protein n=1 Tax=Mycobacterium uberis TaxID=2162698 RepID=A0A3E1HM37_9MYCO|nr:TIGR02234 family membrane protein [Mycobacterium uberis]RFD27305.1 TIGR02234 family membrane protein [Mycobacterium uberis]